MLSTVFSFTGLAFAASRSGSGILENSIIRKASAKIAMAMNNAGLASEMVALEASPIRYPTSTGTMVAANEFIEPPNCMSWFPLFPPPPRVLSIGFTTVLSIHIENPDTKAPVRYTAKLSATPERKDMPTPMKPMATARSEVTLYPYFLRIRPAGRPMNAYAIKFARLPSWDIALVAPNCALTMMPIGF